MCLGPSQFPLQLLLERTTSASTWKFCHLILLNSLVQLFPNYWKLSPYQKTKTIRNTTQFCIALTKHIHYNILCSSYNSKGSSLFCFFVAKWLCLAVLSWVIPEWYRCISSEFEAWVFLPQWSFIALLDLHKLKNQGIFLVFFKAKCETGETSEGMSPKTIKRTELRSVEILIK